MVEPFAVRRVVTGWDGDGRVVVLSDGVPPLTVSAPTGHGVSELWWADARPKGPEDGGDPEPASIGAFPEGDGIAARVVRLPGVPDGTPPDQRWLPMPGGDPERPGMHRSETLDLMVVLDGRIVLGLDAGEYELGPGDAVVQRATMHRWRVADASPCTYLTVLIAVDGDEGLTGSGGGPGCLVTGTGADGASGLVPAEAGAGGWAGAVVSEAASGGLGERELWRAGDGTVFRRVAGPGPCGGRAGAAVGIAAVVSGAVRLGGADRGEVLLRSGDVAVHRGAVPGWTAAGDEPAVVVVVEIPPA
ncbi:cupin domain-containing protein [Yinghuangia soli]|uniref:Cupin type-2 domain-containing protein n=1 Tax=Yinghuangia soli TaxID=2908204 RepID=A0AA41TZY5_9ACTN|nr:cupin domain-containing protein [Yinghuangia soli]MCF2525857.1 hypothetical protein [Yinghuangia soli]